MGSKKKKLKRGILIAIEGIDGAGKTTQAKLLRDKLETAGYNVTLLHEPTEGEWGKKIAELVKNGRHIVSTKVEFQFFLEDRIEDVERNIRPALERKDIVIMDRYYFSSVAYQGARGLDLDSIEKENEEIAPIPDLTIILDAPPRVTLARIRNNRATKPNTFERETYLVDVRKIFKEKWKNKHPAVSIVNSQPPIQEIAGEIWNIVEPIIEEMEEK